MTLDASTAAKLISCVRVNPHHVVGPDSGPEEREVITTISRQPSHALFTSKQIRVLGPLLVGEGGIPLHEYLVGVADRQVSSPKRFENLPNPASTTYYAHYSGDNLTAEQFEVMWQFDNFAKMGKVDGFNDRLTERVLTLRGTVVAPHSTFDVIRRDYVYEGWTKLHFLEFFDLYCIVKAGAEARLKPFDVTNFRWVDVKPPRFLNEDEVESYFDNIQQGLSDSPNRLSKLGSTLDNLASSREDPDRGRKLTNPPVKRPDNVPGRRHSNRHRNGQRRRTWHNEPLSNRVEWPSSSSLSQRARGAVEKRSSSGSRPRNHPRYSNRNQGPGSERTSPGYRFRNHTRNITAVELLSPENHIRSLKLVLNMLGLVVHSHWMSLGFLRPSLDKYDQEVLWGVCLQGLIGKLGIRITIFQYDLENSLESTILHLEVWFAAAVEEWMGQD